tara:strand:- start:64 stop:495 length:432 start_codon:yes stop_codon:yes gene_type:complete
MAQVATASESQDSFSKFVELGQRRLAALELLSRTRQERLLIESQQLFHETVKSMQGDLAVAEDSRTRIRLFTAVMDATQSMFQLLHPPQAAQPGVNLNINNQVANVQNNNINALDMFTPQELKSYARIVESMRDSAREQGLET